MINCGILNKIRCNWVILERAWELAFLNASDTLLTHFVAFSQVMDISFEQELYVLGKECSGIIKKAKTNIKEE